MSFVFRKNSCKIPRSVVLILDDKYVLDEDSMTEKKITLPPGTILIYLVKFLQKNIGKAKIKHFEKKTAPIIDPTI